MTPMLLLVDTIGIPPLDLDGHQRNHPKTYLMIFNALRGKSSKVNTANSVEENALQESLGSWNLEKYCKELQIYKDA
jgi:EAL domain-containing protein (putative c-di-GMP-specific phosphodiesterase class I)